MASSFPYKVTAKRIDFTRALWSSAAEAGKLPLAVDNFVLLLKGDEGGGEEADGEEDEEEDDGEDGEEVTVGLEGGRTICRREPFSD
tara:strand:+ start:68 stop:328 length:261 start_codon:yes stop_codon:yes gene_type:complete